MMLSPLLRSLPLPSVLSTALATARVTTRITALATALIIASAHAYAQDISALQSQQLQDYSETVSIGQALESYSDCIASTKEWHQDEQGTVLFRCTLEQSQHILSEAKSNLQLQDAMRAALPIATDAQMSALQTQLIEHVLAVSKTELELRFTATKNPPEATIVLHYQPEQVGRTKLTLDAISSIYSDEAILQPYYLYTPDYRELMQILFSAYKGRQTLQQTQ